VLCQDLTRARSDMCAGSPDRALGFSWCARIYIAPWYYYECVLLLLCFCANVILFHRAILPFCHCAIVPLCQCDIVIVPLRYCAIVLFVVLSYRAIACTGHPSCLPCALIRQFPD